MLFLCSFDHVLLERHYLYCTVKRQHKKYLISKHFFILPDGMQVCVTVQHQAMNSSTRTMILFKCSLILFLFIAPSTGQVPGSCTINQNGFLGVDSGNLKQVEFLYDLTVTATTSQSVIAAEVIPSLGGAFIQVLSRDVIALCGGQDTGIVGFKTGVRDIIVAGATCLVPSQNPPCVRVRCGMSVYVKESAANLLTVLKDALQIEADANAFNSTVNPQIISVRVDGTSWTFAASPTSSPISITTDGSSQPATASASPAFTNGGTAPSLTPPSTAGLASGVPVATAPTSPTFTTSDASSPSLTPPTNSASGEPVAPVAPSPSVSSYEAPTYSSPAAELPVAPTTPAPTNGDATNNTMLNLMFVMVFILIAGSFVVWFFFRKVKKNHRRMREKGDDDDDSDEETGRDRSEEESSEEEEESDEESEEESDDDSDSS